MPLVLESEGPRLDGVEGEVSELPKDERVSCRGAFTQEGAWGPRKVGPQPCCLLERVRVPHRLS